MDMGLYLLRSLKQPIVGIGLLVQDGLLSIHRVEWAREKEREKISKIESCVFSLSPYLVVRANCCGCYWKASVCLTYISHTVDGQKKMTGTPF